MNNKTIIFIHSFIRRYVSSFVRRPFHPFKPVSPFFSSFRRSFLRPFVPSFVRPFIHSFTHSFVLLAYSCVVRMSRISNRTIGGHQSTGLLSREKQFKFKTIHLLRKPTNNLITKLDWKYAKIKTETGRRCPLSCFKIHEGINIKRNTFTANGDHGIVQWLFKAYHRKHWLKKNEINGLFFNELPSTSIRAFRKAKYLLRENVCDFRYRCRNFEHVSVQ